MTGLGYNLKTMNASVYTTQTTPAACALGLCAFIASTKTTTIKG
jgi:hypothetical protein